MAISYVNSVSTNSGTVNGGSTSAAIVMPTIKANDIAIFALSKSNTDAPSINGSFTNTFSGTTAGTVTVGTATLTVWYKVLTGSESGTTITASWTNSTYNAASIIVYRGVILESFELLSGSNQASVGTKSTASTTATIQSVTTSYANTMLLDIFAGLLTASPYTAPTFSGHTNRVTTGSTRTQVSTNANLAIYEHLMPTAGSTGVETGTETSAIDAYITVGLRELPIYASSATGSISIVSNAVLPSIYGTGGISISSNVVANIPKASGTGAISIASASVTATLKFVSRTGTGAISIAANAVTSTLKFTSRTGTATINFVGEITGAFLRFIGWGKPL